jgi:hypothetical protein
MGRFLLLASSIVFAGLGVRRNPTLRNYFLCEFIGTVVMERALRVYGDQSTAYAKLYVFVISAILVASFWVAWEAVIGASLPFMSIGASLGLTGFILVLARLPLPTDYTVWIIAVEGVFRAALGLAVVMSSRRFIPVTLGWLWLALAVFHWRFALHLGWLGQFEGLPMVLVVGSFMACGLQVWRRSSLRLSLIRSILRRLRRQAILLSIWKDKIQTSPMFRCWR